MSECPVCGNVRADLCGAPRKCPRPKVTEEMVTAAMRAFEVYADRLLRYPEDERWHLNDIQGMREAIKAAIAASPAPFTGASP